MFSFLSQRCKIWLIEKNPEKAVLAFLPDNSEHLKLLLVDEVVECGSKHGETVGVLAIRQQEPEPLLPSTLKPKVHINLSFQIL